jgi:hypothetical protein
MLTPARAYLVLLLDVTAEPPSVASVGIYSEPSPTVNFRYRTFVMGDASAPTYDEAKRRVLTIALHHPLYRWCHDHFDDQTRTDFEKV